MTIEEMARRGMFRLPSVQLFGRCTLEPSAWCRLPADPSDPSQFHSQAHYEAYWRAVNAIARRDGMARKLEAVDALVVEEDCRAVA